MPEKLGTWLYSCKKVQFNKQMYITLDYTKGCQGPDEFDLNLAKMNAAD